MNASGLCWVLSDGKPGMENQCRGLAEAVGFEPIVKRIKIRAPWKWVAPRISWSALASLDLARGDRLDPPWPRLVIATGRHSVAPALAVRAAGRAAGADTFLVQIQNPTVDPARFDLVVVPEHDRLTGPTVMQTLGALHRVTNERLAAEAEIWRPKLAHLPRPLVAVLIGGSNGRYTLNPEHAAKIGADLAWMAAETGCGLAVTPSRRTGDANESALRQALAGSAAYVWDGQGDNPYFGLLGLADAIVATNDSISMISEAAFTAKPLALIRLDGKSPKFDRFYEKLAERGNFAFFDGALPTVAGPPLDETPRVAAEVRRRMGLSGPAGPGAAPSA